MEIANLVNQTSVSARNPDHVFAALETGLGEFDEFAIAEDEAAVQSLFGLEVNDLAHAPGTVKDDSPDDLGQLIVESSGFPRAGAADVREGVGDADNGLGHDRISQHAGSWEAVAGTAPRLPGEVGVIATWLDHAWAGLAGMTGSCQVCPSSKIELDSGGPQVPCG